MAHKNDYSVVAFFPDKKHVKSWTYVHNLQGFAQFLDKTFSDWEYINVYERRTRKYLKRFYKGNDVPPFLLLFLLTFTNLAQGLVTFINGFNNPATIPTLCF